MVVFNDRIASLQILTSDRCRLFGSSSSTINCFLFNDFEVFFLSFVLVYRHIGDTIYLYSGTIKSIESEHLRLGESF